MKFLIRQTILLIGLSLVFIDPVKGQPLEGSIEGYITDSETGESLIGANILLEGTSFGAATDADGYYLLTNIPAGEQSFIVRYLGYVTHEFQTEIIAGETIQNDIELEVEVIAGEEIIVTSQAEGQVQAIRTQLSSNSIVNVVSESRIRDVPDANAAESVGRLPGVSINREGGEAQNVSIRGMSPRYNNITVSGVRVPSTDLDGRSVDLDFLSQEMLSGIELFKSNRPDMDADAIGGSVNFSLAKIPETTIYRVNLEGGYSGHVNSLSNFAGSISGSSRFMNNRLGIAGTFDVARKDRSSDELLNNYTVLRPARASEPHAPLEITNMSVIGRSETRDRLGASLIMDWQVGNGTIFFSNFGSQLNRDVNEIDRRLDLDGNRQNWYYTEQDIEVDVLSNSLSGEHWVPAIGNSFLEWQFSHSISSRNHPYDHSVEFQELSAFTSGLDRRGDVENVANFVKNDFQNSQLWRSNLVNIDSKERDITGQLDITIPYLFSDLINGDFKFGGKHLMKYRDRVNEEQAFFTINHTPADLISEAGRNLTTTSSGNISMLNFTDPDYQREDLFFGNFGFPIGLDNDLLNSVPENHMHRYDTVLTAPMNNQHGIEGITAAYVMTELNLGPRLMFLPGVRYEYTDGEYEAVFGTASGTNDHVGFYEDSTALRNFDQWFPMFQMRYAMSDWFNIRAAYTKSSSRPNYTEIVPRSRINPQGRFINRGNPSLRPSRSTNYDLFFTFHSNKIGLFTLGGFYKEVEDLIFTRTRRVLGDYEELGLRSSENNYDLTEPLNNPLPTTVRGMEIEWQSNFTFLPSPFNGLVVNANFTAMNSETQYPRSTLVRADGGLVRVDTFRVGPMPRQPDYIANVSVGYDYQGFSARATMLHQGPQLFLIGLRPEEDAMTQSILRWDAVVRQQIFDERISIYLNLHNITNEPDGAILFNEAFPTRRQYFGRAFDLGLRLIF
ncbi:MAG: TonB-dependent receptor [Balneolales bacterium]